MLPRILANILPAKIKRGVARSFCGAESSIPAGCLRYRVRENALNKAFAEVRIMVEAVQRYSNSEVNILSRLERIENIDA